MSRYRAAVPIVGIILAGALALALGWFALIRPGDRSETEPTPTTPITTTASQLPRETSTEPPSTAPSSSVSGATKPAPPEHEEGTLSTDQPKIDTAMGYMAAWLTPGTPEQRATALTPYALPDEVDIAKLVDPSKLPTAKAVSAAVDPRVDGPTTAQVWVTLDDGSKWAVALVVDPTGKHGWKVKYLEAD